MHINLHFHDLHDSIQKSKSLNFCSLHDSVLSQDDAIDAEERVRNALRDDWAQNTDYRMLDFLKAVPGIDKATIHELSKAIHHKPIVTKHFCHQMKTLNGILHYGDEEPDDFTWNVNFRVARSILRDELGKFHLQPIPFSQNMDIEEITSKKTASAGAIGPGGKAKNWQKILDYAKILLDSIRKGTPFPDLWIPAVPAHRAQLKDIAVNSKFNPDYKEKDRLIWVVDGASVVVEALFAKPMIEYTKTCFRGYAGGKTPEELIHNISVAAGHIPYWYCTDYSKFDQTIPSWLIRECFDIVRDAYDPKYKKIIDWIQYNFINTKMLLPNGDVVEVHKGIPSGSNFTQLIGSMANFLMGCTYLSSLYEGSPEYKKRSVEMSMTVNGEKGVNMYVMGDDNLFFVDNSLDLNSMAAYLTKNFGVKVNADKTVSGYQSDPTFLHRVWTINGCDRDQVEMCLQLIFPERKRSYETYLPIDIIYSLFYTFPLSFHEHLIEMSKWFRNQYEEAGRDATALAEIPTNELPGSAKIFDRQTIKAYQASFDSLADLHG